MPDPQHNDKQEQDDDQLIVRYLDGQLDEQQFAELNDRLKGDANLRHRFIELTLHTHHLQAFLEEPDLGLVQEELLHQQPGRPQMQLALPLRLYVGIGVALAAVLALAITLAIVLSGSPAQPTGPGLADDSPPKPDESAEPILRDQPVATLTATHNAQWAQHSAEGASAPGSQLRPGSTLHPNTRLTLTAGFAEITTHRGAIAILEAPATIELLNNDNALRLHVGKLVGICETDFSKGFVVRTPHMDITDIGTRFGVYADAGETEVHVFSGQVQAASADAPADTESTPLLTGQSARSSIGTQVITPIDSGVDRFASILPESTRFLSGSGQGLAVGDVDLAWRIIEIGSQALETPISLSVFDYPPTRLFGPQDAKWIGVNTDDYAWEQREERYIIQTQVEIPNERDLDFTSLMLRFHPDDKASSLIVNGQKIDLPANKVMKGNIYEVRITDGLMRGSNDITFEVIDSKPEHNHKNYIGIRASWHLVTTKTPFDGGISTP